MAKREEANPETNPSEKRSEDAEAPSVKEPTETDAKLPDDQEAMQPDSS
jgi:hypothetical protein